MEKINVVILSDDLDLRIEVKNLLQREQFAISGYSNYGAEAKTKIVNLFPEVVLCAVRGDVPDSVFTFVQDLLTTVRNSMVVLVTDNISVDPAGFLRGIENRSRARAAALPRQQRGQKSALQGARFLQRQGRHGQNDDRSQYGDLTCQRRQARHAP